MSPILSRYFAPGDSFAHFTPVANGYPFISPQSTRRVLSELQGVGDNGQLSNRSSSLTERDKDLLRCLVRGLRDKEIARELSLSDARVRNLLSELYAKMGVSGRAQAAAYAVEHRLI